MKSILLLTLIFVYINNLPSQNKFPFCKNNKWFYVDTTMKKVSSKTYDFILPFQGAYAVCKKGSKYGVIDGNEKIIISFQYDTIVSNYYPPFYCTKNKKSIWLDVSEKTVNFEITCGLSSIGTAFWTYKKNNKIGFLDFSKYPLPVDSLPNIYDELHEYFFGIALVKYKNKWGTINYMGKQITDFSLDSVEIINEYSDIERYKLIKYYFENSIGFINTKGIVITKPKYKNRYFTVEDFTLVQTTNNKLVYINNNGREYYK